MKSSIIGLAHILMKVGIGESTAMVVSTAIFFLLVLVVALGATIFLSCASHYVDHCVLHRTRVFVDMDGTVAEWLINGEWQKQGYFESLPAMETVCTAVKELRKDRHYIVKFLTCAPSDEAQKEKLRWLLKMFEDIDEKDVIFVPYGENKSEYIVNPNKNDILLDDHTPNCLAWQGKAVKVMNGINGRGGRWQGRRIYADDSVVGILNIIRRVDEDQEAC